MLPKQYRLTKNKDFEKVAKKGQKIFSQPIDIKYIKNNLTVSRFGIAVSLKIDKKAVVRNKIKRQIRAILREGLSYIMPGFDILILAKPEIKKLDFHELKDKLISLLQRVNLINSKE